MQLVIVESPTKAKTLKKFLGSDFEVVASMGHVRDLPKSKLGVDVEHNFEPEYEVGKGKQTVITQLKKLAKTAEIVYLAPDPDREGEAIAWHLKELIGTKASKRESEKKFQRVTFHEITKSAIEAALKNPGEINSDLVDAQQARRVVDRLVGYTLSPVLWKKVRRGLSAGRVQSVAVRLIVEREKEIEAFKAQEYWMIAVKLSTAKANKRESESLFWAELVEIEGKKIEIKGQEEKGFYLDSGKKVEPIVEVLKKAEYIVEKVDKKERISRPYPPYTTSTLQMAGANVLGWSGKKTMMIAQSLYEAGLITYHRTDSTNIAAEALEKARNYIKAEFEPAYLPDQANVYATKSKNAQEAHEAIRPTDIATNEQETENNGLDVDQIKLYKLIWRRFVAGQMAPAVYDQTSVFILANKRVSEKANEQYRLRANGSVMKFKGWKILYEANERVSATEGNEENLLPELTELEKLEYKDIKSEQKFTQPPSRFNDASLVKELEKRGIGRPSTYAPTISTVITRGYMERVEKRFYPTAVGITVTEFLKKHFPIILDYDFTAEMEEDLDRIARKEKDWRKVMKAFYTPFEKTVKDVEKTAERAKVPVEATGEKCPECETGKLVIRSGKFGKFISCDQFPTCKYTAKLIQKLDGFPCPLCGGDVVLKKTRAGRSFWGCANYPNCEYATWKDPRQSTINRTE